MTTRPTRGKEKMGGSGAGDGCNISNEKEAQGEARRWGGGIKRQKHMNPTDNEDEKTKGKEKEIKRLNNRQ